MKAYRFPITCPVCGIVVADPRAAVVEHANCHQTAWRMAQHANDMVSLAEQWPSARPARRTIVRDTDGTPLEVRPYVGAG